MSYSACDFTDEVYAQLEEAGFISRADARVIDREAEKGNETVAECASAAINGVNRFTAKHAALKLELAAARKRATAQRLAIRSLIRWCDGNVGYFGESASSKRLVARIETAFGGKP